MPTILATNLIGTIKVTNLDNVSCTQYNIIMEMYEIKYLKLPNGKVPVIEWLNSLDGSFRKRINQRILRIEEGNFGDHKKLSEDISELRFDFGKGYRIYYTEINGVIVSLINGGDKFEQSTDIVRAQKLLDEWRLSQWKIQENSTNTF